MAVFMLNVCKFNSCGLKFQSLGHLIQHIEETHIDYDPHVVERTEQQQPACIPLSYVLRFLAVGGRQSTAGRPPAAHHHHHNYYQHRQHEEEEEQEEEPLLPPGRPVSRSSGGSMGVSLAARPCKQSLTPTGSEADEPDDFVSEPDDSNDSWTTLEEFSADFILRYGSRSAHQNVMNSNQASCKDDKPFACPVPGCKKRYKNVNGIKYHSKNGHKNDGRVRKAFKCLCGKSYKSVSGLKNHTIQHNNSASLKLAQPTARQQQQQQQQTVVESILEEHHQQISRSNLPRIPKIKVPAIQDHGYMKQGSLYVGEQDAEYETSGLGVLTPAASPPLASPSREPQYHYNQHKYIGTSTAINNSSQTQLGIARQQFCDN